MIALPFVEGIMPFQMLAELALVFSLLIASRLVNFGKNKFFQATCTMAIVFVYFRYRIYPPVPISIVQIVLTVAGFGVLGWVSSNDHYWNDFCQPISAVLDAQTSITKLVRILVLVLGPLSGAAIAHAALLPADVDENAPIELRTHYPAGPQSFILYTPEDFPR
jgi:hypothetical protein